MASYSLAQMHTIPEMSGDPFVDKLLFIRGIKSKDEADVFLHPSYERDIRDPFGIFGLEKAADRIVAAFKKGEKLAIYSDYDCDGIPGGVVLRDFLEAIGYTKYVVYIPHRIKEGYGMHIHAIDKLKEDGVTLIVTVDSGITNIEEVAHAQGLGIDVIVTDHHLPIHKEGDGQVVPLAYAVINSKQDVCTYHDDMLCGCAVAWKLSCGILSKLRVEKLGKKDSEIFSTVLEKVKALPIGWEKWLLDLVGISTIADMVPLQKENRALAHFGLTVLRKSSRPGLKKLFTLSSTNQIFLTEDDISFSIAPRVNAASRMDDPRTAHEMLFEKDQTKGAGHAEFLETLNALRKSEVKEAVADLSRYEHLFNNDVIVLGDESWTPGIIGLIAQNVIDKTSKVVFVWGKGDHETLMKGSCRSLGDIHVVELMARAKELFPDSLEHSGGHEQAGGFSIRKENIEKLSEALNVAVKHVEKKQIDQEEVIVDGELSFDECTQRLYDKITRLAPFGVGNAKPVFMFKKSIPTNIKWFGKKNEHLEISYQGDHNAIKAIQFFANKNIEEKIKQEHTLIASLEKSYFRGRGELRLRVVDVV